MISIVPSDLPFAIHEDWRDWPSEDFGPRAMTTGLGEILPLFTDGITVIGHVSGAYFKAHITNVPKLVIEREPSDNLPAKKSKSPKKLSKIDIADLL